MHKIFHGFMSNLPGVDAVTGSNINAIGDSLLNGELVPFVGAGVSRNSGAVTLTELTRILTKRLHLPPEMQKKECSDPLFVSQFYENRYGRGKLEKRILENVSLATDNTNLDVQKEICSWPIDTIITTNFDDYLENACKKLGIEHKAFTFQDLTDWHSFRGLKIFKIHGSFDKDEIIVTEEDYQNYEYLHPVTFNILQTLFHSRPILFIGCSLQDENFRRMFHRVRMSQKKPKKNYAILSGFSVEESCMWRNFKIELMDMQINKKIDGAKMSAEELDRENILKLLQKITEACSVHASNPKERHFLFEKFEKEYSDELSKIKIIRKSVPLGFLSTPENENPFKNLSDGKYRHKKSLERKKDYEKILKKNKNLRLIVSIDHPSNDDYGCRKERLVTLKKLVEDYFEKSNFDIVDSPAEVAYENIVIYNSDVMLESRPVIAKEKHDDFIDVIKNYGSIKLSIDRFDRRFLAYLRRILDETKNGKIAKLDDKRLLNDDRDKWNKITKQYIIDKIDFQLKIKKK